MAKQKIVVKVAACCMYNNKKFIKAKKISASFCGVESMSLVGAQITVIGEGIDSYKLVKRLRKDVGCTEIVSVGPAEEKKPAATATATSKPQATAEKKKPAATATATSKPQATAVTCNVYPPICNDNNYGVRYRVIEESCYNDSSCTIL